MEGEFVTLSLVMAGGDFSPQRVSSITPAARRAVGQWPTPESLADRLLAAFQDAAEAESEPERKGRLSNLAQGIGGVGREVLIRVATEVISGRMHPQFAAMSST